MNLAGLNFSNVTNASSMFQNMSQLTNTDTNKWNMSEVRDFSYMFSNCNLLKTIDLGSWNMNGDTSSLMFENCTNLNSINIGTLNMNSIDSMFYGCLNLRNININSFNLSSSTYAASMFYGTPYDKDININNFDLERTSSLYELEINCSNLNINKLNTSLLNSGLFSSVMMNSLRINNIQSPANELNAYEAFMGSFVANVSISNVNVNSVYLYRMFADSQISTVNFSNWNVKNTIDFSYAFNYSTGLSEVKFSNFNAEISNMQNMFSSCYSLNNAVNLSSLKLNNADISGLLYDCWNTSGIDFGKSKQTVSFASYAFFNCTNLKSLDLSNFEFMTDCTFYATFQSCTNLQTINLGNINTSEFSYAFYGCSSLQTVNINSFSAGSTSYAFSESGIQELHINNFDILRLSSGSDYMFYSCPIQTINTNTMFIDKTNYGCNICDIPAIQQVYGLNMIINKFEFSNTTTDLSWLFYSVSGIQNLTINNLHSNKIQSIGYEFYYCQTYDITINNLNLPNTTSACQMFQDSQYLQSVNAKNWNMPKLQDPSYMFSGCSSLSSINISNWNMPNIMTTCSMFYYCTSLIELNISNWKISNKVTDMSQMFYYCNSLSSNSYNCIANAFPKFSETGLPDNSLGSYVMLDIWSSNFSDAAKNTFNSKGWNVEY